MFSVIDLCIQMKLYKCPKYYIIIIKIILYYTTIHYYNIDNEDENRI